MAGAGKRGLGFTTGILALILLAMGVSAHAESARQQDYQGGAPGFPPTKVFLDLKEAPGSRQTLAFQAKKVVLKCENDAYERRSLPPLKLRFTGRRSFEGETYILQADGFQSFYRVEGTLSPGKGKAQGILFYFELPFDPPGATQRPDCATLGQLQWRAGRAT